DGTHPRGEGARRRRPDPGAGARRLLSLHLRLSVADLFGHHGGHLPDDERGGGTLNRDNSRFFEGQPARAAQCEWKVPMTPPTAAAKELLARLVAFDTESAKSNIPLIRFVEDYLAQHGIASQRVPTPDGEKASLFATIGPNDAPGLALSGHTDVVPVAGQTWDSDPFTLTERDGKL